MYYLKRKIKKCKFDSVSDLKGLEIRPRGNIGKKIKNVLICEEVFSNKYVIRQLDKRFKKMYKDIYKILMSEDDAEDGVKACLGEIEKTKSVIFNKYKEHLKNKQYKDYLAKIVILENEFRNKYLEKQYFANMINKSLDRYYGYEEEEIKGKSR